MITIIRNSILILASLLLFHRVTAQDFQFLPDGDNQVYYSKNIKTNGGSNTTYNEVLGAKASAYEWTYMTNNHTTWQNKYKFKSVVNYLKVGIDHASKVEQANYKYKIVLSVTGFSNPGLATTGVTLPPYEFVIEYNKDALETYKDLNVLKLPGTGFYSFETKLMEVFDISTGVPVVVNRNNLAENFKIEAEVLTQRYDLDDLTMKDVFVNSRYNSDNQTLDIYWGHIPMSNHRGVPSGYLNLVDIFKPVKYELEWLYVDDYMVNSNGTTGYKFSSSSYTIPYDFRQNSTRVQTNNNHFSIPMVYGHGAIVFRVRKVRPDANNFSETVYYPWNLAETGTLSQSSFYANGNSLAWASPMIHPSNCLYINTTPFINDSINWQYNISFAEEGKFKHVINYFDGMGKNRQTQTKINSDNDYVVGIDNIYDYEGRPAITTLPTPVLSPNIKFKSNLSLSAASNQPLRAANFDIGCGTDSIAPLSSLALSNIYYSSLNPDKSGMQKYVPDAEGYPIIETRYSADYTDKVQWQGGAGKDFQRWKGKGTNYVYSRAGQRELNRLFGSEGGYAQYYPKQTIIDPNGQASFSITDAAGKVVATGLSGIAPDSSKYPVEALSSLPVATYRESDVLKNFPQEIGKSYRNAQVNYFNEALSQNSLVYKLKIPPFPACNNQFIKVSGDYKIRLFDECNVETIIEMDEKVNSNGISTTSDNYHYVSSRDSAQIVPGKYTVQKELSFSDSAITGLASVFVDNNSGHGLCYSGKEPFVRKEIEQSTFPCETGENENKCDVLKRQMMKELYPGAKYGKYISNENGSFSAGLSNSIFTMIVAPLDVNWEPTDNPVPGNICNYVIRENYWSWSHGNAQQEHLTMNDPVCINAGYADIPVNNVPYPYIIPPNEPSQNCPPVYRTELVNQRTCRKLVTSVPETKCTYEVFYSGESTFYHSCFENGQTQIPGGDVRYFTVADTNDIPSSISVPAVVHGTCPTCHFYLDYGSVNALRTTTKLEPYDCIYYVPPHFRYQSECLGATTTIPIKRTSPTGIAYTSNTLLKDVTPDMLIASFNDEIAEILLPLHPEYCKLQACDDSNFESILSGIESYDEAVALGMNSLNQILSKDPLSQNNPNASNAPFTASELSHFAMEANLSGTNTNILKQLDQMAIAQAYCGSNASEASAHCEYFTYAAQINTMNLTDPAIRDLFIKSLKALYLANRNTRMQLFSDALANDCGPCEIPRMIITGNSVFPKVFNNAGEFAVDAVPPAISNNINNYLNSPTNTIPTFVQNELNQYEASKCFDQITSILNDLKPCVTLEVILGDIGSDLAAYCNANGIEHLNPAALRAVLIARLGSLSDLCQPFVAKYNIFPPDAAESGDYVSQPDALYNDFSNFLNRFELKSSVLKSQPSGSPILSFMLNPTNSFENKIATKLGVSISGSVNVRGYIENVVIGSGSISVVKLSVYSGSNMEYIYLAPRHNATSVFPNPNSTLSFYNAYSVLEEMPVAEGGIADKLAYISLQLTVPSGMFPTYPNPLKYSVWTQSIPFLKLKEKDAIEDCINCEQLRRAMASYWADSTFYSLPTNVKHPLFYQTLKNHLNYTLGATQNVRSYQDLMEGCGISEKFLFRNAPAAVEYSLSTGLNGNLFSLANGNLQALKVTFPDISFPHYAFRRSNGTVILRIDLSSVPAESLSIVKPYLMSLNGSPKFVANGFDAELFKSGSGAPSIAGATVSSENVTYWLSDGTYTNTTWHKYSCDNYLIPNVNAVMSSLADYVATDSNGAYYQVHYGFKTFRAEDCNTPQKTAYLNYVYGMTTADDDVLANSLAPIAVRANVSPFNFLRAKLSYNDPWKENEKRHLYYWDSAQVANPGYIRVINALSQLGSTLSFAKLFPQPNAQVNVSGLAGTNNASIKAFRLSNGNAWIRIFDAQNKLYNIYLIPSTQMAFPAEQYEWVPTIPGAQILEGADNIYRFNITMRKGSHYVKVEGYADFPIGNGAMISNVIMSKNGNPKGQLIDTMTCESGIMDMASAQGMQHYFAYNDSIKQKLRHDMRMHFASNAVDTLILGTREQQYHYTLYYYDQVGNLTKTVPPQGVNTMSDASHNDIENARNAAGMGVSYTQKAIHNKASQYRYNSLNLPIWQQTPDGGETEFFYDLAGRLSFSQNAKQKLEGTYSYTLYDGQGRIEETGVLDAFRSQVVSYTGIAITNGATPYADWVKGKSRTEVVATRYDEPLLALGGFDMLSAQQNLRKRVSAVLYSPSVTTQQSIDEYYHYATHFSYDAMGNVNTLVHDNPYLNYLQQRFKRIDYDYDLLSGKVNMLSYNRGFADQFYQRYAYDADNRITKAETSKDGLHWERDAAYTYYKHGPLAETQLGELSVQGIQYAYTIQGWLKAINGDVLNPQEDMGRDGTNPAYPADVVAHALDYYKGDYKAIDQTKNVTHTASLTKSLYNGNIARQTTAITGMDNLIRDYQYDQLHRIKSTQYSAFDNITYAVTNLANAFKNSYSYDADGNLQTLQRFNGQAQQIDNFTYQYNNPTQNNKLGHVTDASAFTGGNDLQAGQTGNNYTYDVIGNLKTDRQEGIKDISWNSYGKMARLTKGTATADTMNMVFHYDGMGNRIRKDVWREEPAASGTTHARYSDIYVRDAQGNILAVYKEHANVDGNGTIDWLNSQMNNVVSVAQLSSFFATQFGSIGSFSNSVFEYSIENAPAFADRQLRERTVEFYLSNSSTMYAHALNQNLANSWSNLKDTDPGSILSLFNYKDEDIVRTGKLLTVALNNRDINVPTLNKLGQQEDEFTLNLFVNLPDGYAVDAPEEVIDWGGEGRVAHLNTVLDKAGAEAISSAYIRTARNYSADEFLNSWLFDDEIFNGSTLDRNLKAEMVVNLSNSSNTESVNAVRETFATWVENEAPDFIAEHYAQRDLLSVVFSADKSLFLEGFLTEVGIEGISSSITRIPGINTLSYSNLVANAVSMGHLNPAVLQYVNTPSPQNINEDNMWLAEHHLYGSSRLGIKQYEADEYRNTYTNGQPFVKGINVRQPWYSLGTEEEIKSGVKTSPLLPTHYLTDTFRFVRNIGSKYYELSDHLGNVLATVLDRKTGYGASSGEYAGFKADVASATDYFPFGMEMPERTIDNSAYRFGFNTQEKTEEIAGKGNHNTAQFWEYSPRVARRWNLDPVTKTGISDYSVLIGNPIRNFDINGDDTGRVFIPQKKWKNVYNTHLKGIAKNPHLVSPNGKIYLSYDPNRSNAKKRRAAAQRGMAKIPAHNLDEFPYASTREGGANAAVNSVPEIENKSHGGYIGTVVQQFKMRDGDVFEITLIPDVDDRKTNPSPETVPSFNPVPILPPALQPWNNSPIRVPRTIQTPPRNIPQPIPVPNIKLPSSVPLFVPNEFLLRMLILDDTRFNPYVGQES